MKTSLYKFFTVLAFPIFAIGQTPSGNQEEDIFELSPFEVAVNEKNQWYATNAISGTKISKRLLDTPLSINVVTNEFFEATGATDLTEIMRYSSSVQTTAKRPGSDSDEFKIRGQAVRYNYYDGARRWRSFEASFIDRVEVVKGPTAVLYGQALPGGALNAITKKPEWDPQYKASITVDEHGRYLGDIDFTGPILAETLAYRLIAGHQGGNSYSDFTEFDKDFIKGSLQLKLFNNYTKITVSGEYIDSFTENSNHHGPVWYGPDNNGQATLNPTELHGRVGVHPLATAATNSRGYGSWDKARYESYTVILDQKILDNLNFRNITYSSKDVGNILWNFDRRVRVVSAPLRNPDYTLFGPANIGETITYMGNDYVVGDSRATADDQPEGVQLVNDQGEMRPVVSVSRNGRDVEFVGNRLDVPGFFDINSLHPGLYWHGGLNNEGITSQSTLNWKVTLDNSSHNFVIGYEYRQGDSFVVNTVPNPDFQFRSLPNGLNARTAAEAQVYRGVSLDFETGQPIDVFGRPWIESPARFDLDSSAVNLEDFLAEDTWLSSGNSGNDDYYLVYTGAFFSEKLHVMGGIRRTEFYAGKSDGTTNEWSDTLPQVGILYKVVDGIGLYASYSESFLLINSRFPILEPSPENPDAYDPGSLFPPERGTGLDIGVKFGLLDGRLSGNVTYYEIVRDNFPVQSDTIKDRLGNFVVFPSGEQEANGVEAELFYQTGNLNLMFGAMYGDSVYSVVDSGQDYLIGEQISGHRDLLISLAARYQLTDAFWALAGVRHGSDTAIGDGDFSSSGYLFYDLAFGYSIEFNSGRSLAIQVNANNVTDKLIWDGITAFPPRTIQVRASFSF